MLILWVHIYPRSLNPLRKDSFWWSSSSAWWAFWLVPSPRCLGSRPKPPWHEWPIHLKFSRCSSRYVKWWWFWFFVRSASPSLWFPSYRPPCNEILKILIFIWKIQSLITPQCLQIFTLLSFPPEIAFSPPTGAQSTAYTSSAWPGKSNNNFYCLRDQTFKVESFEPLNKRRESLDQATWKIKIS